MFSRYFQAGGIDGRVSRTRILFGPLSDLHWMCPRVGGFQHLGGMSLTFSTSKYLANDPIKRNMTFYLKVPQRLWGQRDVTILLMCIRTTFWVDYIILWIGTRCTGFPLHCPSPLCKVPPPSAKVQTRSALRAIFCGGLFCQTQFLTTLTVTVVKRCRRQFMKYTRPACNLS